MGYFKCNNYVKKDIGLILGIMFMNINIKDIYICIFLIFLMIIFDDYFFKIR